MGTSVQPLSIMGPKVNATSKIHAMVLSGRVSSEDGALLLALRRELEALREREIRRHYQLAGMLISVLAFLILILIGSD